MAASTMPQTVSWGPNFSGGETANFIAVWGNAKVQRQFPQGSRSNAMATHMQKHGHQWYGLQCCIKFKALWTQ